MRRAVYAGSFDPITNGHFWMIEEGARLFDEIIISAGVNPNKSCTFSIDERLEMLEDSIKGLRNARADSFEGMFLVNYAMENGAGYILRGIRNEEDYEYEKGIYYLNTELNPAIKTVFLIPPIELSLISSSMVKSFIGPKGWEEVVKKYVPEAVYDTIIKKFQ